MMKKKLGALAVLCMLAFAQGAAFAACDYDSDRASDGSRCGKRSSQSRDGGK